MKVCTDACLFGAWVAQTLLDKNISPAMALDIGTGTGLLSLMLAQKNTAIFDALEIDAAAAGQAKENVAESPWRDRIQVVQADILQYPADRQYDLIISNPPFYESDLRSENAAKNAAKHDTTLTLQQLIGRIASLLTEEGIGALLIPYHRTDYTLQLAADINLYITHQLGVRQTPRHQFFRTMLLVSKNKGDKTVREITIHDNDRKYTPGFSALLESYYLDKNLNR